MNEPLKSRIDFKQSTLQNEEISLKKGLISIKMNNLFPTIRN